MFSAPIALQRQFEALSNPMKDFMENSSVSKIEKMVMPWVGSTIFNSYETGMVDFLQNHTKQFDSFQQTINIFSQSIDLKLPKNVDWHLQASQSLNYLDKFKAVTGFTFKSIIEEFPEKENFETEKEIFEKISHDPELKKEQELLFVKASQIISSEDVIPMIFSYVNKVGDKLDLLKNQRIILLRVLMLIMFFASNILIEKVADLVPSFNNGQPAVDSNITNIAESIRISENRTNRRIDSIIGKLTTDLIISKTYLYENSSIRSKHIGILLAQTEVRIIDYKGNWCYLEVIGMPEIKGWVMNKKIEKFQ